MQEVHRPRLVRRDGWPAIVPELRLHATLRRLVPQLQAELTIDPVGPLGVHLPALTTKQNVDAPISVAHPRRADILDPAFEAGLLAATGFVMEGRRIELKHPTGPPDRHIPFLANPSRQLALAMPLADRPCAAWP